MQLSTNDILLATTLTIILAIILVTAFVAMKYWGPDRLEDRESRK